MPHNQRPRLVSSAIVGALIGGIYVAGLTAVLYYTEMRDRQNDNLAFHLEAEIMQREQLRGIVNEIVQDNKDLAAIAGRRLTPQDYPLSPDPSVDPRDNNQR
jgi:hypothetical protein